MTTTEALELEGVLLAELRGRAEADDDIVRMTPERLERWWRTPAKFVTSDQDMSTVDSLITHTPSGTFYDPSIVPHGIAVADYHKCSYVLVEYH